MPDTPLTASYRGLYQLGGGGLVVYGALFLVSGIIDLAAGPPPVAGPDVLAWVEAHHTLLAFPSELLLFQAAFLVPGVIALGHSLAGLHRGKAVTGCGLLGIAISVMAFLAIVHGRLAYPVYGLRVNTPDIAAFVVALYFGGLHAISLLIGLAVLVLSLAMRRGVYGPGLPYLGLAAGIAALIGGYPYAIGPILTAGCQALVVGWFLGAGAKLHQLGRNGLVAAPPSG